jgi:tRNA threonylcarbamoyladenosine biosynthesis protein TsaB
MTNHKNYVNRDIMDKHLAIAIDTSGRVGSAAIGSRDQIFSCINFSDLMRHAAELFPALLKLTADCGKTINDITDIYVTSGPGSFTGLRIGITAAKMMALASGVKVASVSSLDCVAMNAFDYILKEGREDIQTVAAVIDAKRGQFFVSLYKKDEKFWRKSSEENLSTADEILAMIEKNGKTLFNGEALKFYRDKFENDNTEFMDESQWGIDAKNVYKASYRKALDGYYDDPRTLLPRYLRLSDAEENLIKRQKIRDK